MNRCFVRLLILSLLSVAVGGSAAAQSAEKIIERHIQAAGAKKPLKAITSTRYVGDVQGAGGTGSSFVWMMKEPHFLYLETNEAEGAAIEAFNGRSAWRHDAANGLRTLTGREQARARATALFRNDRFLNYKKDKTKVQLLGHEAVAGRDAFAIRITTASGLQRKVCFDTQTYLLLKEEQERDDGPEEILYADYRPLDGVMEPFRLTLRRGGRTLEVVIRQVTHNVALANSLFDFPRPSDQALPDVGQLWLEVEKNQKQIDQIQELYTYNAAETQFEVDRKGNVRQKSEKEYEVFYLGGDAYRKLVGKDGRKLSEGESRKEQEKAEKFIREYEERKKKEAEERAKGKTRKDDDEEFGVLTFLQMSQFLHPRRERYRGQPVIVFDFEPRPGYKPRNRAESLVHKLAGTLWVDEQARQVARLEARTVESFRIGGGLVASLGRGSALVFEQELVRNEVWLPSYAEFNLSARVLLVAGLKVNRILRFSNYQKFRVETTSEIKPPAPPN